jgi:hypothetical protein
MTETPGRIFPPVSLHLPDVLTEREAEAGTRGRGTRPRRRQSRSVFSIPPPRRMQHQGSSELGENPGGGQHSLMHARKSRQLAHGRF